MTKRPRDTNQLAKLIADITTKTIVDEPDGKNPKAVARGRRGGLKGGASRAAALSPARRAEIGRGAAQARWSGRKKAV